MNELELRNLIERQGYEFLGVRHFKKGFRVRYQDQDARYSRTYHTVMLEEIHADGSKLWHQFLQDFRPSVTKKAQT
jgi:hypothetical protein